MATIPVSEILVGIYLGLLAAIFPAFIAFTIGFVFKYFTNVTVPGLGVVVLGGALAGVSGGLMGLVDPQLAGSESGITAVMVILMACLWAHSQGDKLGAATPRWLTLKTIQQNRLSADLVERVDSYGQIRVRPRGVVGDIEGYPSLSDDLRAKLGSGSWKFPANLSLGELEDRLAERLTREYELAEVSVTLDKRGRAELAAAPSTAGLSRRVPSGRRAVSVRAVLPTGIARGDRVTIELPDGDVTGAVVSARTFDDEPRPRESPPTEAKAEADEAEAGVVEGTTSKAPTTTGGEGRVTVALPYDEARRVIGAEFAPVVVHSRGKQREYEAIGLLKQYGNRFQKITVDEGSALVGRTIDDIRPRGTHSVAIVALRRPSERHILPAGAVTLEGGDELIVVGKRDHLGAFAEVAA
ncbi:MAG: TrkA C-terminal domain-containing protein [Haloferacaceae archaeon]